jgi:pimeloyl-ACP methyl ester carboxylesterase
MQLAEALADAHTVYLPDRRGRGLSGPYRAGSAIAQEVEDLDALLTATGTHDVLGVSSGAIISLQAALSGSPVRRAAIFEPPLMADNTHAQAILARFDSEMARGKVAAALITGMKGAELGPAMLNRMPRWLAERLTGMAMAAQDKKGAGDYVSMRALAPLLHYDFTVVYEMSGNLQRFRAIPAEVLLLGGSQSPAFLKAALDILQQTIPQAQRIELPDLGHAAVWNTDLGGQPLPIAQELRRFFA